MADQLMCCDFGKVIQIQKDDFMHYDHEFEMLPYFRDKTADILKVDETGTSKAKRKFYLQHLSISQLNLKILLWILLHVICPAFQNSSRSVFPECLLPVLLTIFEILT